MLHQTLGLIANLLSGVVLILIVLDSWRQQKEIDKLRDAIEDLGIDIDLKEKLAKKQKQEEKKPVTKVGRWK